MQYVSEFISVAALGVAAFAFVENRRNNRLGKAPSLLGSEVEEPAGYSYSIQNIQNKGTGPARPVSRKWNTFWTAKRWGKRISLTL